MSDIVRLADKRPPVTYTVTITHHWDGRMEFFVEGVSEDTRSQRSVADAMQRFGGFQAAADALHSEILNNHINKLMNASSPKDIATLNRLATIVEAYETVRFPV